MYVDNTQTVHDAFEIKVNNMKNGEIQVRRIL